MRVPLFAAVIFLILCIPFQAQKTDQSDQVAGSKNPLVTFIELGSVNCIPCKQMQPVMEAIEKKYGDQVKVVFYDVWKPEQKHYAQKYQINLIPTQVFLDDNGKEFHRHQGFYPEAEIDKILQQKGLLPLTKKG